VYKVRNISKGKIVFGDLNLILSPEQEVDLDEMFSRERVEQSMSISKALSGDTKKLDVLHKDEVPPGYDPKMMQEMEARLRAQITEQMALQPLPEEKGAEDISALQKKLDLLINIVTSRPVMGQAPTQSNQPVAESPEDFEKTVSIQEKLLKRLSKNVESSMEAKQEVKKSDIEKRANELEDLL
jgi:hypothetical protein